MHPIAAHKGTRGTGRALSHPFEVIMISSPFAARSSSCESRGLAARTMVTMDSTVVTGDFPGPTSASLLRRVGGPSCLWTGLQSNRETRPPTRSSHGPVS